MIAGIGVDIVEIDRIKEACQKNSRFMTRVFTEAELAYAIKDEKINYQSLAGMWAAKEAYAKASGQGFRTFKLKDVEVIRNQLGAPSLQLYKKASDYSDNKAVHLSISHSDISAIAFCIIESK